MRTRRTRVAIVGVLTLALSVTAGLGVSAEAKKKKKKQPSTASFSKTLATNLAIPDYPGVNPAIALRSDITVGGKKFKGKEVTDVNVTVQTTGNLAGAAADLNAKLSAPNGRTFILFDGVGDQSIGPWKMDDDTRTQICDRDQATLPCVDPDSTLNRPFAGTSNLNDDDDDVRPLATFNGVSMKGNWTLTLFDDTDIGETSTLNQWRLELKGVAAPK